MGGQGTNPAQPHSAVLGGGSDGLGTGGPRMNSGGLAATVPLPSALPMQCGRPALAPWRSCIALPTPRWRMGRCWLWWCRWRRWRSPSNGNYVAGAELLLCGWIHHIAAN